MKSPTLLEDEAQEYSIDIETGQVRKFGTPLFDFASAMREDPIFTKLKCGDSLNRAIINGNKIISADGIWEIELELNNTFSIKSVNRKIKIHRDANLLTAISVIRQDLTI